MLTYTVCRPKQCYPCLLKGKARGFAYFILVGYYRLLWTDGFKRIKIIQNENAKQDHRVTQ